MKFPNLKFKINNWSIQIKNFYLLKDNTEIEISIYK